MVSPVSLYLSTDRWGYPAVTTMVSPVTLDLTRDKVRLSDSYNSGVTNDP